MIDNIFIRPDLPATKWGEGQQHTLEFRIAGEAAILEHEKHVPLIGLSGVVIDVEIQGEWAAIKLLVRHEGHDWDASFIIQFANLSPNWLKIGAKLEITEEGLKYHGKRIRKKAICLPNPNAS